MLRSLASLRSRWIALERTPTAPIAAPSYRQRPGGANGRAFRLSF